MKVIAFNGSPRKAGNTYQAIKMVAEELELKGIEVEIVNIGSHKIQGCQACGACKKRGSCIYDDDDVNKWIDMMKGADGIILASPTYFSGISGTMKAFLDRAGYTLGGTSALRHKVAVSVAAVRRTGGLAVLDTLDRYINYFEMLKPASNYWNVIYGAAPGEVSQDEEGKQIMRVLGKNMAWLMQIVEHGKGTIPPPEKEAKIMMSFIR